MTVRTILIILVFIIRAPCPSLAIAGESQARLFIQETTVKAGNTVSIEYRTVTGLKPELDIYDANNLHRVKRQLMAELGTTGAYEARLYVDPAWGAGDFTIVVSESLQGTFDNIVLTVLQGVPQPPILPGEKKKGVKEAGIRDKVSTLDQDLTDTIKKVARLQALTNDTTRRVRSARDTADQVMTERETLEVQQMMDSILRGVVVVLGRPSDPVTVPTVFGLMAQLQEELNGLPAEVTGSSPDRAASTIQGSAGGAQGHLARATTSAQRAVVFLEQILKEFGTKGKTTQSFEMLQQVIRLLDEMEMRISTLPKVLNFAPIVNQIRAVTRLLKRISGEHGMNLDTIYDSLESVTNDLTELRGKMEQVRHLLDLNKEVIEKALDRMPSGRAVIKTWLEPGSVIIKILVVNPSATETKTVPVKHYLPQRVTPKDIVTLGDLKVEYDREKDLYFVYGEVALPPGQSVVKKVEIADIWLFSQAELTSYVAEATTRAGRLVGTPSAAKAFGLATRVEKNVDEIFKRQADTTLVPAAHIEAYQKGQVLVNAIKRDLAELGRLESLAGPPPKTPP